ncbi:MAG: hypothetical protein KC493_00475 [Bacteriovoracaceae bacterium]|nr:hypothetical protein [Bacteriovoracaceae bacterium]
MKDLIKIMTFIFFSSFVLTSCGELSEDERENDPIYNEQVRSLNGVLYIRNGSTSTYNQLEYKLGTQERVLLRLENLGELSGSVVIDDTHRMMFEVTMKKLSEAALAKTSFKLCPLLKNWMMLATWTHSHPFPGGSGPWITPGGDFHESECIEVSTSTIESEPDVLKFDVSDWFVHYNQSRGQNFGWVLKSSSDGLDVYGDAHISKAPKLKWQEFIK